MPRISNANMAKRAVATVMRSNQYKNAGNFTFVTNAAGREIMQPNPGVPTINQMLNHAHRIAQAAHKKAPNRPGPGPTRNMIKNAYNKLSLNEIKSLPPLNTW